MVVDNLEDYNFRDTDSEADEEVPDEPAEPTENVGIGCGMVNCNCPYCNNDNYDRYIADHCSSMLDCINQTLREPVNINTPAINGDRERYYKVIMRVACLELQHYKLMCQST